MNDMSAPRRDKPWMFRTYAGHSNARRFQPALSLQSRQGPDGSFHRFRSADADGLRQRPHPLARGEVGKVGVPVSHLGDMRTLFDGIPLGEMNTSMTINATAVWLMALYIAAAEEQGVAARETAGHDAKRHHQGISVARLLCVSADAVAAPHAGPHSLHDEGMRRSSIR